MQTHNEILMVLLSKLRKELEAKGETEAMVVERLDMLGAAANDLHLPNQPEDVLQGLVDTYNY